MKFFAAALATETNTFSPIPTDLEAFKEGLYAPPGTHPDTPTLCTAPLVAARGRAREEGWTLVEGTATWADPAGTVNREVYEQLRDEILGQLEAALPVDGVFLGLHGAMVAHGYDDCEGDLIQRVRHLVGPEAIIGAELDMHCHITHAMTEGADVLIAFKEFPHIDFALRAAELVDLCLRAAKGTIKPVMSVYDCRIIGGYMTSREPGRSFVDRLMRLEGKDGVLSISIGHGFTAADVAEVGTKVIVVTDDRKEAGARLAESLGRELIEMRELGWPEHLKPDVAIDRALAHAQGPVVLADRWDSPGGGVAGDSTVVLRRLLERGIGNAALGAIWDPVATRFCMAAGAGARLQLRFGSKAQAGTGEPIDAEVLVTKIVPNAHQTFRGSIVPLGDAAAIRVAGIEVVLKTNRAQTFDPSLFTNLGIEPKTKKIVVVKSSNHFYDAFARIAAEILYVDSGGPYPSDARKIPYTRIRRPIWPLDDVAIGAPF
ncbi:MAG: M81 family metallopeptidase [Proteobacteria bacterium]|nr:M81 family metallopeptidase [Pseudomonadota bacterium]MBI3498118.1 M81 family metallopeptidase [Pseudomonadota bacterium]